MALPGRGGTTSYGLKFQARCVVPVVGDQVHNRFLVGTTSLREENEVHLIEFVEESETVKCVGVFRHAREVWQLAGCPTNDRLFFSVYNTGLEHRGSLWRWNPSSTRSPDSSLPLEELAQLSDNGAVLRRVMWSPSNDGETLVALDESTLRLCKLDAGSSALSTTAEAGVGDLVRVTGGAWDPHNKHQVAITSENTFRGWDLRSMKPTYVAEGPKECQVRDIDFNPNRPYHAITGHDDGKIRFWDVRKPTGDLHAVQAHLHWVWCVRFNPFHDQLILSSSTDRHVHLWRMTSASSAWDDVAATTTATTTTTENQDKLVDTLEDFDDSVYSLAWSACDAWVFASLSYDGRVVLSHVPASEKYKILL